MNVKIDTIIRTIVLALALVNQICAMVGWIPLELSEDTVYQFCTLAATVGTSLWAWWKNNSFTRAAKIADIKLHEMKK